MTPSRRDFLRSLLALPMAATLDVEKLLWVPRPMITVPGLSTSLSIAQINAITLKVIMPGMVDHFFRADPLIAYLAKKGKGQRFAEPFLIESPLQ